MATKKQTKIQTLPEGAFRISNFAGGLNLRDAPHLLQDNEALELDDVVFSEVGALAKRGGYEKWNISKVAEGNCYGLFRYKGTPSEWVLIIDDSFYVGDDTTKSFTQLATGFQEAHWIGVQIDEYLFLTNGEDIPQKFDGTNLYMLGVEAPDEAPTLTYNATGTLPAGTYYYRITFVGEGVESSLGKEASITTTAAGSIDLSDIPISTDPQVAKKRIYRSKVNDPSTFYFVEEIGNLDTIYNDDTEDSDLGDIGVWYRNPPNNATAMAWWKSRLWINDVNNPQYIWFSRPWEPQAFDPEMGIKLSLSGDDKVIALLAQGDNLVVYCQQSIWLITGSTDYEFTPVGTYAEEGIYSYLSPTQAFNTHFIIARKAIFQFENGATQEISAKIKQAFDWADINWLALGQLLYYPNPQQRLLLFPLKEKDLITPPETCRVYTMVYDLRFQAWIRWNIPMQRMALDENEDLYFTLIDPNTLTGTGYIYRYSPDIYTDDGQPITFSWASKLFFFDNETIPKGMRRLGVVGRVQSGIFQITIMADGGNGGSQTLNISKDAFPAYYGEAEYSYSYYAGIEPQTWLISCQDSIIGRYIQLFVKGVSNAKHLALDSIYGFYRLYPARREVL